MKEIKDLLFDGTNEEFCQLVESYKMLLYSVVYAASAYADADDIVQETFIYAYYHWGTLRDKGKLSSWLCAIAKNKAARAMKTKGNTLSLDEVEKRLSVSSPEASFLHQERREEIRAKIGELSEIYREPIMLYYFAKKNVSEISEILSISKETVKFRLYEGRKKLKKELIYLMDEENERVKKKAVWAKIENELHRAKEAYGAFQRGEANAICDTLIEQFEDRDLFAVSKDEIALMTRVYIQKFYANKRMESREKNIVYIEKAVELAEFLKDEKMILNCYFFYSGELEKLRQYRKAGEYDEKTLALAEKLGDVPQIAKLNYFIGARYITANDDIRDIPKAKAYFEKAVSYKDELLKSDYGKHVYALAYSGFIGMSRVKNLDKLNGFFSTSPNVVKTKYGLDWQTQLGFFAVAPRTIFMFDVFSHMMYVRTFLSNCITEGYHFETNSFWNGKTPVRLRYEVISMHVRAEVPAGIFEDCLHIRYTEKTDRESLLEFCGVHDFFYAPNVGLVQMHFKAISGTEYTVKLKEYEVRPVENGDLCDRYFPLTVGNVWYYEPYGPAVKRFENEYYESRYEVVAKRRNDTLTEHWLLSPEMKTGKDDDVVTMLAHSGWLIKK